MRKKNKTEKKHTYRLITYHRTEQIKKQEKQTAVWNILISCATDIGWKDSNQDYFAYRFKNRTVTSENKAVYSISETEQTGYMVAGVADGVSMTYHPQNPADDAQTIALQYLLNQLFYQFGNQAHAALCADELNQAVTEASARLGGMMATTLSAICINGEDLLLMYIGDSPIIRIQGNTVERITPVKTTNFLLNYLGNPLTAGRNMMKCETRRLLAGDIYIVASDGGFEALTETDGSLNSDMILDILKNHDADAAKELISVSGNKKIPATGTYCTDNRTAVIIRVLEAI